MAAYSELLRTQGVARIIIAQLVARFPAGMTSLAILMHVERITGSYGAAGTVLAATSIGQAVAGPVAARWMGRWGTRPVIGVMLAISAISIAAIAVLHFFVPDSMLTSAGSGLPAVIPFYMVLGVIAGLSTPPIQSAVRTIYPKLVNARQLTPLFSLDASLQEIIWIIAPVVITMVTTQLNSVVGLLLIVAILIVGGAWFLSLPEVGKVRIPAARRGFGKVLLRPAVLLATVIGFVLVGACAAVEAGVIANFGHGGLSAGLVLAVFSVGSLVGGLFSGRLPIGPWSTARRLCVVVIGLIGVPYFVHPEWALEPYLIGAGLFIAGLGVAPVFAAVFAMTSASVKFSDTAEAYGWISTGQLIGGAAGSAVAGFLIDAMGAAGAYVAALGFAAAGVLIASVFVSGFPDLRGRDASPIPDTAPITTVG